jgi:hypothetical protein
MTISIYDKKYKGTYFCLDIEHNHLVITGEKTYNCIEQQRYLQKMHLLGNTRHSLAVVLEN